ncbi:hypothetical protein BDR05DRAFT_300716 [Suillus weaverae]|nr:hypothetical protein BDR05DRAFT_300716 [Suillus weaverae]
MTWLNASTLRDWPAQIISCPLGICTSSWTCSFVLSRDLCVLINISYGVDAFLYRASAMLPPTKQMVLNVEYNVFPVSVPTVSGSEVILVGFIDYTVVVTKDVQTARIFLNQPGIRDLVQEIESVLGFFVVEAKDRDVCDKAEVRFPSSFPDFTLGRKTHIRGTLTNSYEWLFLVLSVNPNGNGASYRISDRSYSVAPYETGVDMDKVIPDKASDMITGILASWIEHSCEDLLEDDWYV